MVSSAFLCRNVIFFKDRFHRGNEGFIDLYSALSVGANGIGPKRESVGLRVSVHTQPITSVVTTSADEPIDSSLLSHTR